MRKSILNSLFSGLKSKKSAKSQGIKRRILQIESLEERQLLSVTSAEYEAIQTAFSDFKLSDDPNLVNQTDLEELSLNAIINSTEKACETKNDDLIVLRASENEFISFVDSLAEKDKLVIKVDYNFGAVNIVGINSQGDIYNPLDLVTRHDYSICGEGFINGDYHFLLPDDFFSTEEESLIKLTSEASYTQSWQSLINLDDYYNDTRYANFDGSGYATVIIDSGIYADNVLFQDAEGNSRVVYQYDFAYDDEIADDTDGHGTHVAGIAAGYDSTRGYSGVAPGADIIALKVFTDDGASGSVIEKALQWVVNHAVEYNIASVNMSLGSGNYQYYMDTRYSDEITTLAEMGVATCIATGNNYDELDGEQGVASPACIENCISVGAVHSDSSGFGYDSNPNPDQIVYFTQRMEGLVDIFAPGVNIKSAGISGSSAIAKMSGTSMATPVISGTFVLARQLAETFQETVYTPQDLLEIMSDTAVTIYDGDDEYEGYTPTYAYYKRIDVYSLANSLSVADADSLEDISLSTYAPSVGTTISTTLSPSGATASYQWYRGTSSSNITTPIYGATTSSYTVTSDDVGYYLKAVATGTGNYTGTVSASTTSSVISSFVDDIYEPNDTFYTAYDLGTISSTCTISNLKRSLRAFLKYQPFDFCLCPTIILFLVITNWAFLRSLSDLNF